MHDILIKNGTVFDGTGSAGRIADVAIDGDRITAVGSIDAPAKKVIDAKGMIVTPGFVDVHTHYDGQVFWDADLTPSNWHGVTTIVTGNCGVGFAPVRNEDKGWLIDQMEGVEDIPAQDLIAGMPWNWESFPEYLDEIAKTPRALDVACMLAHGPLRAFVLGAERNNGDATPEEVSEMARLAREALEAGAIGISANRMPMHRAKNGEPASGTFAPYSELTEIAGTIKGMGHRVFLVASDLPIRPERDENGEYKWADTEAELDWLADVSRHNQSPAMFLLINRTNVPDAWRGTLERTLQRNREGAWLIPETSGKPTSIMLGWEADRHLFSVHENYLAIAGLPLEERIVKLRDPEIRKAILEEDRPTHHDIVNAMHGAMEGGQMYVLGNPPDYEPGPEKSVKAVAEREGKTPLAVAYDAMCEDDGLGLLYLALDWDVNGTFNSMRELLMHPSIIPGLADGGAHLTAMCDAGMSTFVLTHWVRDRKGDKMPLEMAVHIQTQRTANAFGFFDRGVVAPGYLADVNVIDYDNLALKPIKVVHDLPSGGRRFIQGVAGYRATIKSGQIVRENDESTGVRPGGLVRGNQPKPVRQPKELAEA
ncbi:N-acyl-D-amino-acid deacylase family protein [Novosphingobium malaysiense]|uniref:Amidohydrolase 3 domain-containing protein n=1 Tax=Novosphingobium malaysiense TaxID=1348853 RepID=A0A0B1ZGW2_9SPHN|nr:amidohydrolase family protein [Novosphingobium malaysiense]KHK90341.1 hypothetical protein LK12_17190 [Novosphingobium malaysiense]